MGTVLKRRLCHSLVIRIDQTGCSVFVRIFTKNVSKSNQMDTISILTEVTGSGKFSTTIPHFFLQISFLFDCCLSLGNVWQLHPTLNLMHWMSAECFCCIVLHQIFIFLYSICFLLPSTYSDNASKWWYSRCLHLA